MKLLKIIKKLWWLFLIGFLIGGGVMWYFSSNAKKIEANSYTVKRQTLTETLSLSGEIDAEEKAELRFQTSGLLTWVGVKEGDYVKKYQTLASLDKRDLQNSMSKLLNTYSKTRWDFEQAQDDNKDWQTAGMTDAARAAVKRTLDKYQFDLNNSVLSVESQALALKFASLWTPIEGVVTSIDAPFAGQNITPATATFEVINPKTIYFSSTADQTEVTSFVPGMTGQVTLDSFPDTVFEGTVQNISFTPKAGESGTVYEIKVGVDTTVLGDKLKLGMTGDINFVIKEIPNVLVIPEGYLKKDNGKYSVTVIEAGKMIKKEVTVGDAVEGMMEITGGLNEKDVIYNQP
jgi:membrane fusion protein, multidrug efflux system